MSEHILMSHCESPIASFGFPLSKAYVRGEKTGLRPRQHCCTCAGLEQPNKYSAVVQMQAGHAATTAVDSDSDQEDFEQYSELDAFDTDEVEVSPDDEQALAAFMVSCAPTTMTPIIIAAHDNH